MEKPKGKVRKISLIINPRSPMITNPADKEAILAAIDGIVAELLEHYLPLNEDEINKVPYENSWTPRQLLEHVTKSTNGIATALMEDGKVTDRDVTERVPELKTVFLDFSTKMKSPDAIVPGNGPFEKDVVIDRLKIAFEEFSKNANHTNLEGLITD